VLLTSDLAESNYQEWREGVNARPHLYAALGPYPLQNAVFGLPYRLDEKVKQQVRLWTTHEFHSADRIVLVSALPGMVRWVTGYLNSQGYTSTVDQPNQYSVVTFRKISLERTRHADRRR
jgi:hypothetical protein